MTAVDWLCGPAGAELGSSPRFFSSSSSASFSFPFPFPLMAGPSSGTLSASLQNTNAAVTISTDGLRLSSDPRAACAYFLLRAKFTSGFFFWFFFPSLLHLCSVHHSFQCIQQPHASTLLLLPIWSLWTSPQRAGQRKSTSLTLFLRNTFSKKSHQLACSPC